MSPCSPGSGREQFPFVVPEPRDPVLPGPIPSFSILITAYEAAGTIEEALESALTQTRPAHEVVVVDDGSTDELVEVLRPYEERITLVSQPNAGGAAALNAGIAVASGEFVAILDADDSYDPRRLEALGALAAARPDLDLVTTDAYFVHGGERAGRFHRKNAFATADQRRAILQSCFVGGWPAVRRARLLEVGGFDRDLRVGYDWDCWIRLILSGSMAGLVDEPYLNYRVGAVSLTSDRVCSLRARVTVLEKAAANPALRSDESPLVRQSLRRHRTRAALAEAEVLVGERGRRTTRRRLFRVARQHGLPLATRARIVTAAATPSLGSRILISQGPRWSAR